MIDALPLAGRETQARSGQDLPESAAMGPEIERAKAFVEHVPCLLAAVNEILPSLEPGSDARAIVSKAIARAARKVAP